MGSNINWIDETSINRKNKSYLDTKDSIPVSGWKTIVNVIENIKCDACTRRIKKGQKILIHSETSVKMHKPEECKLW